MDSTHSLDSFRRLQRRAAYASLLAGACVSAWIIVFVPAPRTHTLARIALIGLYLAAVPWLRWRPRNMRWIAILLMAGSSASLLAWGWTAPQGAFPDVLDLLPFTCFFATIFGDAALADIHCLGVLVGLGQLLYLHPWLQTDPSLRHVTNLMLVILLLQFMLRAFWQEVRLAARELEQVSATLEHNARSAQALAFASFQEVRLMVQELNDNLGAGGSKAAHAVALALERRLGGIRSALAQIPEGGEQTDHVKEADLLQARLRGGSLYLISLTVSVALARNVILGFPYSLVIAFMLAVFVAVALLRRVWPARERWLFRAAVLIFLVSTIFIGLPQMYAAPGSFSANQCVQAVAVLAAALLDAPAFSFFLMLGFFATLPAYALLHPGYPSAVALAVVAVCALACWVAARVPQAVFSDLIAQRASLSQTVRRRRRLISMLFHDLANPLQVASYLLELDQDLPRVRRMAARMQEVLGAAQLLDHARVELQPVTLRGLLQGLEDLFRERLAAKAIRLSLLCRDLGARAQPQLLLEGVLGNLLSNAIKFAPVGSAITVECGATAQGIELRLSDQGPGIPAGALKALEEGRRPASTPGSLGELGSGYGLILIRDYLDQMGGSLELLSGEDQGTVALVRLQPA